MLLATRRAAARQVGTQAVLLLVGGPAGAGKSTVAVAWCRTRQRAVRIDLDEVRDLIIAGSLPDAGPLPRSHQRVLEEHTIAQHQRTGGWSADLQLDTTDMSVERTLEIINNRLSARDST